MQPSLLLRSSLHPAVLCLLPSLLLSLLHEDCEPLYKTPALRSQKQLCVASTHLYVSFQHNFIFVTCYWHAQRYAWRSSLPAVVNMTVTFLSSYVPPTQDALRSSITAAMIFTPVFFFVESNHCRSKRGRTSSARCSSIPAWLNSSAIIFQGLHVRHLSRTWAR